jgi:disulfide bond formation protein DsbB
MPCPFHDYANKILLMPKSALLILAASAGSLIFALIFQFGFGYEPCILCLWQRVPFIMAILLAVLTLTSALRPYAAVLLYLCVLVFLTGAGLAIFHTGVEQHWWLGTSGCTITPLHGGSVEDLRTQLLHTVVARCDEVKWKFLGLSMANYNVAYSLVLAVFSLCAARKAGA